MAGEPTWKQLITEAEVKRATSNDTGAIEIPTVKKVTEMIPTVDTAIGTGSGKVLSISGTTGATGLTTATINNDKIEYSMLKKGTVGVIGYNNGSTANSASLLNSADTRKIINAPGIYALASEMLPSNTSYNQGDILVKKVSNVTSVYICTEAGSTGTGGIVVIN
jgi:hypothetical protein